MATKKYSSIRIFENPVLEAMTHVHPIIPLCLWVPIIAFFYHRSYEIYHLSVLNYIVIFISGIILWTLSEYLLHRFVFHFPAKGRLGKRFVFLFHGLHHDDPQDPTRLVMPPVPALLITSLIYALFSLIFPKQYLDALFASFMIGYLFYDYIHFATHHFAMTSKVGKFLRSYHLKHHHQHRPGRYGVSSPLWDYIFQTVEKKA